MSRFSLINTNIQALEAFQTLSDTSEALSDRRERLTTGLRVNSASDDAAGFEIAKGLETKTNFQEQALRNIGDAKSTLSIAEGALDSQLNILQSAREKAVQAANGSLSQDERDAIAGEVTELVGEVNDIAENTTFNGDKLITGGTSGDSGNEVGLTFQTGSESGQTFDVAIDNSTAEELGVGQISVKPKKDVDSGGGQSVSSEELADSAVTPLEGQITVDTDTPSSLGGELEGGSFEIQVSQTATDKVVFKVNDGGVPPQTTTATGTSGGAFNGTSTDATLALSTAVGGNMIVRSVAARADIKTDSLIPTSEGGEAKSFTVEVRDSTNIGRRLGNGGAETARSVVDDIDGAISDLTSQLSDLGASQNRLSFKESNLETSQTNLSAAQSRIEDADVAREQTQAAKLQLQQQSGIAQLAQANTASQSVLSLLG